MARNDISFLQKISKLSGNSSKKLGELFAKKYLVADAAFLVLSAIEYGIKSKAHRRYT